MHNGIAKMRIKATLPKVSIIKGGGGDSKILIQKFTRRKDLINSILEATKKVTKDPKVATILQESKYNK